MLQCTEIKYGNMAADASREFLDAFSSVLSDCKFMFFSSQEKDVVVVNFSVRSWRDCSRAT